MSDPLWYKDAIIYELHVRTFHDSNADGIGDFRGLMEKLDYLQELGISAIWLLPFYPSPLKDDGYDIANYLDVNPNYGTLDDFRVFLDAAHERGLRVITELVINHTSDQNPWFQKSRRAPPGSPEREVYVWSDTPEKYKDARIIFKDFETSNWSWDPIAKSYYWHRFYSHQPDLNFDNPAVHEVVERVCDFWLKLGVDGLRLDAVPYLYEREGTNCENLPETHVYLKNLRAHIDAHFSGRMLLAEANQWPERRSFTTATKSEWATIFISVIAMAVAPRCNGAPIATPDFPKRIHSSFTCRSRLIRNTTTKRSTSRISKRISHHCCGGCGASSPCEKIIRPSPVGRLNFYSRKIQRCWHFSVAPKTKPLWLS